MCIGRKVETNSSGCLEEELEGPLGKFERPQSHIWSSWSFCCGKLVPAHPSSPAYFPALSQGRVTGDKRALAEDISVRREMGEMQEVFIPSS